MWTLTWRGVLLGAETPFQIVDLNGVHDAPDVRTSDVDRARTHGQWAGIDLVGGRAIQATIDVAAEPGDSTWATFTSAFSMSSGAEEPLVIHMPNFAGGGPVTADVRLRRRSLPLDRRYSNGWGIANVEWWATDPRFYDANESSVTVPVYGTQDNGMTFDATFDQDFGGVTPRGAAVAHNLGNFAAPWRVVFDGPVTNPKIQNTATGQRLELTGTVPGGSQLVVDSLNRVVQLDGASRYQWLGTQSQWFDLAPGTTPLRIVAESGTGAATLTYRSTWI